jgi:hypothetical protein
MMKSDTLWGDNFGMLMASASPGSALAYHLGQIEQQARILRRSMPTDPTPVPCAPSAGDTAQGPAGDVLWRRVRDALQRFAQWSFERERERYLAQYADLHQLEARAHRRYRDAFLSRARGLR